MKPTTEELVAILKKCAESDSCLGCPHLMIEGGCIEHWMRTAADRLEELEAELVALKEQQRWIPVTKSPKEDGQYLVECRAFGTTWIKTLYFAETGEDVDAFDLGGKKNVWYEYDTEYGYVDITSVAHWMPLPEPPKEE